jgi:hypothetical protein
VAGAPLSAPPASAAPVSAAAARHTASNASVPALRGHGPQAGQARNAVGGGNLLEATRIVVGRGAHHVFMLAPTAK